jgi:hypothetical protein
MADVRIMDREQDYKDLGVNPRRIETWEDGRRSDDAPGSWEWWYFDGIMDDGTKIVIQFFTKTNDAIRENKGAPNLAIKVTLPDGTHYEEHPEFPVETARYGEGKCDVHFGDNRFVGDFSSYEIHVDEVNGLGADLKITSLSRPYRPGTAYFEVGDKYYTWLCSMPKGVVDGYVLVDGDRRRVHGGCYHDHQWGTINLLQVWNHWLWSRQSFDDCSIMVFDMVAQEKNGGGRFPIAFIQDARGNLLFENHTDVNYGLISTYQDLASGKTYPRECRYEFEKDDIRVVYTIREKSILENRVMGKEAPMTRKIIMWMMGLNPTYARYSGMGDLSIYKGGKLVTKESGELIYEFMYPGKTDFTKLQ